MEYTHTHTNLYPNLPQWSQDGHNTENKTTTSLIKSIQSILWIYLGDCRMLPDVKEVGISGLAEECDWPHHGLYSQEGVQMEVSQMEKRVGGIDIYVHSHTSKTTTKKMPL